MIQLGVLQEGGTHLCNQANLVVHAMWDERTSVSRGFYRKERKAVLADCARNHVGMSS